MKLLAREDILANERKIKSGSKFDMDKETALVLIRLGWAVEVATENVTAETADIKPKKNTRKKV